MDAAAAPPPDLTTVVAPLSRGPPSAVRPPGQRDPGGSPTVAGFDLLLQMLGAALPAGQSLPVGGSGLPVGADGSATAPGACAGAAASTNGRLVAGSQTSSTTLADWLRLALAGASGDSAAPAATDGSAADSPASGAVPTNPGAAATVLARASTSAAASASADPAPIDLQALLGSNADAQAPAQPLAALVNAAREQLTGTDSQRRTPTSVTPADAATQTASDLKPTDQTAPQAPDAPLLAAVTQIPAAAEKTAHLDADALSLAVTPTTGTDAGMPRSSAATAWTSPITSTDRTMSGSIERRRCEIASSFAS